MTKKVYLDPAWKLPSSYDSMIDCPPTGYEFIARWSSQERFFRTVSRWEMSYGALESLDKAVPLVLAKSWLERRKRPPGDIALTYAHGHLVFRPEPWVVEVEYAHLLLGSHPKRLKRFHGILERMLASPYCRKIRCWSEVGRRTLVSGLRSEEFEAKIEVIPHAVRPKRFPKEYADGTVKLLFVGSANIKGQFEAKGGLEVLETFALLRQRYQNLELIVRSDMPVDVKVQARRMEGVRVMDNVVSGEALEREYRSADIFLLPSHSTPPFTLLDAMSYELPVVSINAWANGELIEDGKTGLLAERSKRVPYYYGDTPHPTYGSPEFHKAIRVPDPQVVGELTRIVSLLIETPELRRSMGRAGRWEVEDGKFSIAARNEKLKRLFDEAIARQ